MEKTCKNACENYRESGPRRTKPYCNSQRGRPLLPPESPVGFCEWSKPKPPASPTTPES